MLRLRWRIKGATWPFNNVQIHLFPKLTYSLIYAINRDRTTNSYIWRLTNCTLEIGLVLWHRIFQDAWSISLHFSPSALYHKQQLAEPQHDLNHSQITSGQILAMHAIRSPLCETINEISLSMIVCNNCNGLLNSKITKRSVW